MDLAILATMQRSGSTLLQRIFNARPRTLVWGEGGRVLTHLSGLLRSANLFAADSANLRPLYLRDRAAVPAGLLTTLQNLTPDPAALREATCAAARAYFARAYQLPGYDLIGVKEVRHGIDDLRLFRAAFPDAHVVLLCRDPAHVWRSMPAAWRDGECLEAGGFINEWNRNYRDYQSFAMDDAHAYFVHYEDLVARAPPVVDAIREIGRLSQEEFAAPLGLRLGSHQEVYEISEADARLIRGRCAAPRYC